MKNKAAIIVPIWRAAIAFSLYDTIITNPIPYVKFSRFFKGLERDIMLLVRCTNDGQKNTPASFLAGVKEAALMGGICAA